MNHATSRSFYRAEISARSCLISIEWEQPAQLAAAPQDTSPLAPARPNGALLPEAMRQER